MNPGFILTNALLGIGLAMDAFSVSLANGLAEPCMKRRRAFMMAGLFALFQAAMPMIGWVCVHNFILYFKAFEKWIPWIALVLLLFIGGKMLLEGIGCAKGEEGSVCARRITFGALLLQALATSIDALSVGFTIAEYNFLEALGAVAIIAALTFVICYGGVLIGKKFGTKLSGKASILGGVILILIGIEIFISSFF
ncbi:MAG: manganese efflux pump [Clostridia bacterium]|nr:manganese efflux pump [Clostridia bacterium]